MSSRDEPKPNSLRTYPFEVVVRHMHAHHPGCPKETQLAIATRVSAKEWKGLKLGAAVGIELQNFVRHSLTDYDELLRSRIMTREEARTFVAPQIEEILRVWRKPGLKLRARRPERET